MTEATRPELPDHLSVDPRSPHHVAAVFEHDIGIRFNRWAPGRCRPPGPCSMYLTGQSPSSKSN